MPNKKAKLPLSKTHPKLAKEADGWDPSSVTAGIAKKVLWKCSAGHNWEARINNRAIKKYGCPICSGQQILAGFNDLATLCPEIASEAYGWDPTNVAKFSNLKLEWKCSFGHKWKSTVTNRTRRGDGCAVCSSHKTLSGFNDLATTDPELAKQAYGWDTTKFSRSSNKKLTWVCNFGHTWTAPISNRSSGSGCPYCSGKKVLKGFNDLKTVNTKLAIQATEWDPSLFTRSSNKKVTWKCNLGHIWNATVNNRAKGDGCPFCGGKKVLKGFNDLATVKPEIAKDSFGWDPSTVTVSSHQKKEWKCVNGHIYLMAVSAKTNGNGCAYCANQKILKGFNDIATTHPELVKEAFGWDPTNYILGTQTRLKWKCGKGHIWIARGADRKRNSGCPFCAGVKVLTGFNDLNTLFPEIAKEAFGWDPKKVLSGSGKKLSWKCSEGHKWKTDVFHRTGVDKTGCPTCSVSGFNPNADGFLYFLVQNDWEMFQIGITNIPDDRIQRHKRLGWEILEIRGPMDGHLTQQWETAILRMLKAKGADLANKKIAGKFDGYSEAWSKSTFPVKSIKELMRLTEEFEEGKK